MTGRELSVDRVACSGHGACAELLPELITLDEWGYPVLAPGPVPPPLRRQARRAAAACPALALRLDRLSGVPAGRGPAPVQR
jgi:ferredoxin